MASVTMPSGYGASGNTYTDDSNASTGLANYGYATRLVPLLSDTVTVAGYVVTQASNAASSATAAAASASSALNAPGTNATSSTSVAVGSGSKSFTIQTGKAYVVGQTLNVASAANPANFMAGQVTSYNSGTGALVVNVTQTGGSGTYTDWVVSMGAIVSSTLPSQTGNSGKFLTTDGTNASWNSSALAITNGGTGATTASGARTNLGVVPGTDVQAYSAKLAALAAQTWAADTISYQTSTSAVSTTPLTSFGRSLIDDADAATARTTLGLVIGTNVQAYDAELAAIAGLTSAADRLPYFTGLGTAALATFTSFGRSLVDDADAATARTTLAAAASGANSDITSLSGLTTPLSVAQGGTGSGTVAGALSNLGISRGAAAISTGYELAGVGYAIVSGGVLTSYFDNGFSIVRNSNGNFSITLDVAASGSTTWCAVIICGHSSLNVSAMPVTQTASGMTFHTRNGGNSLNDPESLHIMIYINS